MLLSISPSYLSLRPEQEGLFQREMLQTVYLAHTKRLDFQNNLKRNTAHS